MTASSGFGRTVPAHVAEESGIYVSELPGLVFDQVKLTKGAAMLARFMPKASCELLSVGFVVAEASEEDEALPIDVGIYDADLNLLSSNGGKEAAEVVEGVLALDLAEPVRVQAGHAYYAGLSSDGAKSLLLHLAIGEGGVAAAADLVGDGAGERELIALAAGGFPLPKDVPVGAEAGSKVPFMTLRTAAAS